MAPHTCHVGVIPASSVAENVTVPVDAAVNVKQSTSVSWPMRPLIDIGPAIAPRLCAAAAVEP